MCKKSLFGEVALLRSDNRVVVACSYELEEAYHFQPPIRREGGGQDEWGRLGRVK